MPIYAYRAKDGPVRTVEGRLRADSPAAVLASLEAMGLTPVWVGEAPPDKRHSRRAEGRIPPRQITAAARQLASLTRAGVPILRALTTVSEQTDSPALSRVFARIEQSVREGGMLSQALAAHPRLFPDLFVNMVRAGEAAGILDGMLDRLADARDREEDTRRRVQAAVAYPLLIVAVGAATVFVLLAFFLPRVIGLFRDQTALPLPTRILVAASDFTAANWHWLLLGGAMAAAVIARLASLQRGRLVLDAVRLRAPLIGRFARDVEVARFARTLALLLDAGIAVDRALTLAADTVRNSALRAEVVLLRSRTVEQGLPISDGLKRSRWFPPMVGNMAAVGEESGHLDAALAEVAAHFEKECEHRGRLITSLLEPALILVVGGLVAFIVSAMLLPLFRISFGI